MPSETGFPEAGKELSKWVEDIARRGFVTVSTNLEKDGREEVFTIRAVMRNYPPK